MIMNFARAMSSLAPRLAISVALAAAAAPACAQPWIGWFDATIAADRLHRFDPAPPPPGTDPLAVSVIAWDRLRDPAYPARFEELSAFLLANPGWPDEATLRAHAERAVGPLTPMADRLAFFTRYPAQGGGAVYRLAEAYAAAGRQSEAEAAARRAWTSATLPIPLEADLLARFGATLTPADHTARADTLLWSRQTAAAARMLALLPADRRAWAAARLALQTNAPDAVTLAAAVPPTLADDPGLLIDRAHALQTTGNADGAGRLMADHPVQPGTARDPVRWMRTRLELARAAEKSGQFDTAYRLAADHAAFPMGRALNDRSLKERDAFTDIEWFAGFVALHDLHRPTAALQHYSRYQAGALSPATRAKGLYWAARAAEAAGDHAQARAFLAESAQSPETFYGQLATERLGTRLALPASATALVTPTDRARVAANPLARAAQLLASIGARDRQSTFLRALAERATTPAERQAIADLGPSVGRPDLAVIVGKAGRNIGEAWSASAYPSLMLTTALPDNRWSITHAITRQESQFDQFIRSHAGALGLMQLMPATARGLATKLGLGYSVSRLTSDQDYNVTLGSTYYGQLLDQWGGNNVLAVASYNAGAGNVRKWIALNGDPREPGVDVVAWIEAIPFSETRTYVERVLENAVVYDLLRPKQARSPETNRLSSYLGRAGPA